MLDAVLFDLDHTLLTYDQDRGAIVGTAFAAAGVGRFCSDEVLRAAADDVPAVDSDHEFLTELFRIAAERHDGPAHRAADLARAYGAAVDHTAVSFRPGAERALGAARGGESVG